MSWCSWHQHLTRRGSARAASHRKLFVAKETTCSRIACVLCLRSPQNGAVVFLLVLRLNTKHRGTTQKRTHPLRRETTPPFNEQSLPCSLCSDGQEDFRPTTPDQKGTLSAWGGGGVSGALTGIKICDVNLCSLIISSQVFETDAATAKSRPLSEGADEHFNGEHTNRHGCWTSLAFGM